jgi:hypothetical protein
MDYLRDNGEEIADETVVGLTGFLPTTLFTDARIFMPVSSLNGKAWGCVDRHYTRIHPNQPLSIGSAGHRSHLSLPPRELRLTPECKAGVGRDHAAGGTLQQTG